MSRPRNKIARWRYRMVLRLLAPVGWLILQLRRLKGKEHPTRWREKLGHTDVPRPDGTLIWLHGVGLGEVLSTRPVIAALRDMDPTLQFLVTSSTRASADVAGDQLPDGVIHQFLPLDTPAACKRFLRHWDPDLSIWMEQDIWPGMVLACSDREIPLALLNARMMDSAAQRRQKALALYEETYRAFDFIAAQDKTTAKNLRVFVGYETEVLPNLKSVAPPLQFDPDAVAYWQDVLSDRAVWSVGSAHLADIRSALQAHLTLRKADPNATLILLPRYLQDIPEIETMIATVGLTSSRTDDGKPDAVLIETTMGKSGVWYSISAATLVGGGFDDTGGHSPWEAVALGCGVLYGPNTQHFSQDYNVLDTARGAIAVRSAGDLSHALMSTDFSDVAKNAKWAADLERQKLIPMFSRLASLIRRGA